ncbi:MAG: ABC transporter ATP-binding protein [Rhodospirillales bacterium]|nr:ABC transporter ATP-binding protein [Rhodospirillales bacterium]
MTELQFKVQAKGVKKHFHSQDGRVVHAIDNVTLDVGEGEFVALLGPSGCGKSTFLFMVAGFEQPSAGTLTLDGEEIREPGPNRGIVFQEYVLFPWRTVKKNIEFGLEIKKISKAERDEKCRDLIHLVGLAGFEDAYPHTLSGGMKQRVSIARALAYDPDVLLMDEPFGALDAQTRRRMIADLVKVHEATKKTFLFVTHSVDEAIGLADRICLFSARPSIIKQEYKVSVPRPRNVTSDEFVQLEREILESLDVEVEKMMHLDRK